MLSCDLSCSSWTVSSDPHQEFGFTQQHPIIMGKEWIKETRLQQCLKPQNMAQASTCPQPVLLPSWLLPSIWIYVLRRSSHDQLTEEEKNWGVVYRCLHSMLVLPKVAICRLQLHSEVALRTMLKDNLLSGWTQQWKWMFLLPRGKKWP